jgi:hypothetical protein
LAQIDIELPENLQQFLEQPRCLDLKLPEPGSVSLKLPSGGTIQGIGDITQGIPTDCSLSFSLLLQLGPLLGSLDCFVKVLKLIEPLIDVIKGLPFPPVEAIKKFAEAAPPVAECALAFTPQGGLPLFIKDILCVVIKILKCLVEQFKSIAAVMGSIALQIEQAQLDGNQELLDNLECAEQNAATSAAASTKAIEPIVVILELVAPLVEIAQVGPIEIPTFGSAQDVDQINDMITVVEDFVDTLQQLADALGGCD